MAVDKGLEGGEGAADVWVWFDEQFVIAKEGVQLSSETLVLHVNFPHEGAGSDGEFVGWSCGGDDDCVVGQNYLS